jgi:hypothetical protein
MNADQNQSVIVDTHLPSIASECEPGNIIEALKQTGNGWPNLRPRIKRQPTPTLPFRKVPPLAHQRARRPITRLQIMENMLQTFIRNVQGVI